MITSSCQDQDEEKLEDRFTEKELSVEKVEILGRACEALREKRYDFETRASSTLFFEVKTSEVTCANPSLIYKQFRLEFRNDLGRGTSFYWEGPRNTSFFRVIVTDQTNPLASICDLYFNGSKITNLYIQGHTQFHFDFAESRGSSKIKITTLVKKDGELSIREIEGINVNVNSRTSSYGHIIDRELARSCGNGRDHHFRQLRI